MVVPTDALRRAALNLTPRAAEEEEEGRGRKKSDDDEDRTRCCSAALEQEEEEEEEKDLLLVRRIEEQLADDDEDDDENDVEAHAKTLMTMSFYASRRGESLTTEIGKNVSFETSPKAHRISIERSVETLSEKRNPRERKRPQRREKKRTYFLNLILSAEREITSPSNDRKSRASFQARWRFVIHRGDDGIAKCE